jgi:hypothetical protein
MEQLKVPLVPELVQELPQSVICLLLCKQYVRLSISCIDMSRNLFLVSLCTTSLYLLSFIFIFLSPNVNGQLSSL